MSNERTAVYGVYLFHRIGAQCMLGQLWVARLWSLRQAEVTRTLLMNTLMLVSDIALDLYYYLVQ